MDFSRFNIDLSSFKQPIEEWDTNVFAPDDALWKNNLGIVEYWGGNTFSGTMVHTYPGSAHLIEYEDGIKQGKYAEFWDIGQCSKLEIFERGRLQMRQNWYRNEQAETDASVDAEPQLALHITKDSAKGWYKNGTLEYEATDAAEDYFDNFKSHRYYFPSGSLKMTERRTYPKTCSGVSDKTYFFHDGTKAFRRIRRERGGKKLEVQFDHDNIFDHLSDLMESPFEESGFAFRRDLNMMLYGNTKDRAKFFEFWLKALREALPQKAEEVLRIIQESSNHELFEALNIALK